MADKNNIADENYLDNLLKAITGEGEDVSEQTSADELDFDSALKQNDSEEAFLSDFEKEFFEDSESDVQFDDSDLFGGFDDASMDTGIAAEEEVAKDLVDAAVDVGDTSVEEDLQGLYGILGVDNAEEGLPENVEDKPKKKGLFGRKDKEKKEKKPKEKKEKKSKKDDAQGAEEIANDAQGVSNGLEGLDVEALFDNVGNSSTDGEEGFDMSGDLGFSLDDSSSMDMGADDSTGFDFGLDDSGFGDIAESENDMLIRQMEEGELDEDELLANDDETDSKKAKKEKKKKEKKEKKEKAKKEKAPKKAKPAKVKKEKAPKVKKPTDPDDIIHVPIIAIILMLSFVVVAVVAAKMGGDYYYYQERIYDAVELYVDTDQTDIEKYEGRYSEAYRLLSGLEMRNKEHQAFFDQVQTIMFMDQHYEAYKNYMLLENFDNGLDSLIKAIKMYDKYQNQARDLGCFDDMTVILSWVDDKLENTYGITESRARELSMLEDDQEYAIAVRAIAHEAEAKYLEMKAEEELE